MTLHLQSTPEFGAVGDYTVYVFVNGERVNTLPPTGVADYATRTVYSDVVIPRAARHVVVAAAGPGGRVGIANPVWMNASP